MDSTPFLDDDDRIDGLMYPQGAAVKFLEASWGGNHIVYLEGLIDPPAIDYQRWTEIYSRPSSNADWRLSTDN